MNNELNDLLEMAIYEEIASQALYGAGQNMTQDPGAKALIKELAEEERKHAQWLKDFKDRGLGTKNCHYNKLPDLKISDYLTSGRSLHGAGLQETLIFAMKHEQHAIDFYSRMMSVLRDADAKCLCQELVQEELKHKLRLEMLYDDLFYRED